MIGSNQLAARTAAPLDLESVDCYHVILESRPIIAGTSFDFAVGSFSGTGTVTGTFTDITQPTNQDTGKALSVTLDGANLGVGPHLVVITGDTYSGATTETLSFSESGRFTTSEFWIRIDSIDISCSQVDISYPAASINITEAVSITIPENSGDHAFLYSYDNGVFTFRRAGTDIDYDLEAGYYLIDYPSPISIEIQDKRKLVIGASVLGTDNADSIIEFPAFYSRTIGDVRTGESASGVSQTSLHLSPYPPDPTPDTTMLLDLDEKIIERAGIYPAFLGKFKTTSESVNPEFEDALYVDSQILLDNARQLVSPNSGTIEFFLSPMLDTYYDNGENRFILDITSLKTVSLSSTTSTTIILPFKVRSVNRVYLSNDATRTDLLGTKGISSDGRTIRLPSRLPAQRIPVVVEYTPVDFYGDRISLYLDGYNNVNFSVTASNTTRVISREVNWSRGTWHRLMITWDVSNVDNIDQMRLFIDGTENNIITWGSPGFTWGGGHVWGTSSTSMSGSQALVDDINLTDEFSVISIGTDFAGAQPYLMRMDNLRFSSIARQPIRIGLFDYDLVWNDNISAMFPVIEDAYTKGIFDFDRSSTESEFLANLLTPEASLYSIGVEIDDGFNKILSSSRNREILLGLYQRIKPAHMRLFSKFKQED